MRRERTFFNEVKLIVELIDFRKRTILFHCRLRRGSRDLNVRKAHFVPLVPTSFWSERQAVKNDHIMDFRLL
jgi:hypothetical protein